MRRYETIFIAHEMFCLSFVIVTVKARLSGLDANLEQAAMDLYASERTTFWKVTASKVSSSRRNWPETTTPSSLSASSFAGAHRISSMCATP